MAEAEITIRYRTAGAFLVNKLALILTPVMIIFMVWTYLVGIYHGDLSAERLMIILFSEMLIILSLISVYILSSDEQIYITREGLFFPPSLLPRFAIKSRKAWQELAGLDYRTHNFGGQMLTLKFKDRSRVNLDLRKIPPEALDNLIVAIDVWGGGRDNFPALLEIRSNLDQNLSKGYTDLWEEELTSRFAATNFIPLEPGEKVYQNRMQVDRQMAFGGMSAIYLVSNLEDRKKFVLKESMVPDTGKADLKEKADEMLRREAELLSKVDHPRIARVFDHFVENGRNYILLEHLSGMDLRRLVKEYGPQSGENLVEIALQIAEIIEYLHGMTPPLIHKDLTPSNLIMENDNCISLIDFGAANLFLGTATGTIIGKQSYMAPEQLRGKATLASDIYSFGCTVYFVATGADPTPIKSSDPNKEKGTKLSKNFNNLMARCTDLEPTKRPSAAEIISVLKRELQK
ncbi:MAG: serine/threonine protein kinase [Candidatus Obscuribacterales bacterium]|nr:serine/threonine protein kinase [Candidatus Obscuribacterales bacterium]